MAENLRLRAEALFAARSFFRERGYLEVETPLLVPSPGLDVHLDAFSARDHRGKEAGFLITSPEYQMKRLLVAGFDRIVQFCRCFRAGELGDQHEPEFTMLEWYRAGFTSAELIQETRDLVVEVAERCTGKTTIRRGARSIDLAEDWQFLTVEQAFDQLASGPLKDFVDDEDAFFLELAEVVQPQLGIRVPTVLTHWPSSMASLARLWPDDPRWADRFEVYVDGIELANGFGELTCAREQRTRFSADQAARRAASKPIYPIDERFLSALEEGMPEASGNALGVDRLVMLLAEAERIQDVVTFGHARL